MIIVSTRRQRKKTMLRIAICLSCILSTTSWADVTINGINTPGVNGGVDKYIIYIKDEQMRLDQITTSGGQGIDTAEGYDFSFVGQANPATMGIPQMPPETAEMMKVNLHLSGTTWVVPGMEGADEFEHFYEMMAKYRMTIGIGTISIAY